MVVIWPDVAVSHMGRRPSLSIKMDEHDDMTRFQQCMPISILSCTYVLVTPREARIGLR